MNARQQLLQALQDALRGAQVLEESVVANCLVDAIDALVNG